MHLTGLDFLFWAAGFMENLALLFTLWYRRRAKGFPFFTALITLSVVRTIVMYFVLDYGTKESYFHTYWSLAILDTMLELCVVYEVASRVFRPLGEWARRRAEPSRLAGEPERNRSFGIDLAGKSARADVDASHCDKRPLVFGCAHERIFRRDDGSFRKREASMENARRQDCPRTRRVFADQHVGRDRTQLLRCRLERRTGLYSLVPYPHGCVSRLCRLLDHHAMAR